MQEDEDNRVHSELNDLRPEVIALRDKSRKLKDENRHVRAEFDDAKSEIDDLVIMNENLERLRLEAQDDLSMLEIKSTLLCDAFNRLLGSDTYISAGGRLWLKMDNEITSTIALKDVEVSTIEQKLERGTISLSLD